MSVNSIFLRRIIFFILISATMIALSALMFLALSKDGFSWPEYIMLGCFLITLPWTVIGFWNAVIGLALMRLGNKPAEIVFPALEDVNHQTPINASVAIAMCVRNEDVALVNRNLSAIMNELDASGHGKRFGVYILSDSFEPTICQQEKEIFDRLQRQWADRISVTYRRRDDNADFKAGNIRDFCERWGKQHEYLITLDADSVMSASTILRMVRVMEQNEDVGILQSLVVGLPSASVFTRVFQFGMRMGMRSYTLGSAWWQADCGPYWGHNAILRMKPFMEHCQLPTLSGTGPLSGSILSHDQVEATFMRRAGFECRVMAEESQSYEENPPHILEFIRRDLRWCHGNMQYFKLLGEPGLKLISRVQLVLAILMFIGSPAWMLFVVVATASLVSGSSVPVSMNFSDAGFPLFVTIMGMIFAPKIATVLDTMLTRRLRRGFGGTLALGLGAFSEILFSMLLAPIMAIANTLFLAQLFLFSKPKKWEAQIRDAQTLPVALTAKHLWPQTLFGVTGCLAVLSSEQVSGFLLAIAIPVFVGPLIAIVFGVVTSSRTLGRMVTRLRFWLLPEEASPSGIVTSLNLEAVYLIFDKSHAQSPVLDEIPLPPATRIDPAE